MASAPLKYFPQNISATPAGFPLVMDAGSKIARRTKNPFCFVTKHRGLRQMVWWKCLGGRPVLWRSYWDLAGSVFLSVFLGFIWTRNAVKIVSAALIRGNLHATNIAADADIQRSFAAVWLRWRRRWRCCSGASRSACNPRNPCDTRDASTASHAGTTRDGAAGGFRARPASQ
jgi:hypothetical protein